MRLLAHLLMKLFVLIVQSSVSYLFEMTIKLESLLNKLLNEGELIMKWDRKIKNKGNLVNAV